MDTTVHVDSINGDVTFKTTQSCDPIAEHCKALVQIGSTGSNEMRHAASFPRVMIEKYLMDKGITFSEFMGDTSHVRVMLSDPALAAFRIWDGKV